MGSGQRFNEELSSLYRSSYIFMLFKYRRLRWAGHVARMEEGRIAFKTLTRKLTVFRKAWAWEDDIRMDLKRKVSILEIGLIRHRIRIVGELL